MRFMFKQHTLKQGKQQLVYPGNRLQGKRTNGSGMERRKIQRQGRKRISLVSIARKKGTMMGIAGNCTQRRDQSGSNKGKGGKKLQRQHNQ